MTQLRPAKAILAMMYSQNGFVECRGYFKTCEYV